MFDHLGHEFGLGHAFKHDLNGIEKVNLTAGFYGSIGLRARFSKSFWFVRSEL